jgi:tryptophan synthase alpha chain
VTGARRDLPQDARELVQRLRRHTKLPVAVGFGIATPEQFAAVGKYADAAVVGSAVVQTIELAGRERAAEAVGEFVAALRSGSAARGAQVK